MNTLSDFAEKLMKKGFSAGYEQIQTPEDNLFKEVADEIYNVPEKPLSFNPSYFVPDKKKYDIAILISGGLDSTICYLMAEKLITRAPDAYYIDIGQPYKEKEINALKKMGIEFQVIKTDKFSINNKWQHIYPARNFYFLTLVAEKMDNGGEIWIGALEGEMPLRGGDKSVKFFQLINELFSKYLPYKVRIKTPLANMTKTDEIEWAKENGYLEIIKKTISCFNEKKGRCGKCQSCLRTWIAFYNNNIKLDFNIEPMIGAKQFVKKYKNKMGRALREKDFSHYSRKRCLQTLKAFERWENENIFSRS